MKKEITFLELLQMVKDGTAPKKVIHKSDEYKRNGSDYICRTENGCWDLSSKTFIMSIQAMATAKTITYSEEILTDEEKAYLSAVLKPFRKHKLAITKEDATDGYNIIVMAGDGESQYYYFPIFPYESEMYKGMEVDKKYTPSELGLWEEE